MEEKIHRNLFASTLLSLGKVEVKGLKQDF